MDKTEQISIIRMQTDDTLGIGNTRFIKREKSALKAAGFVAKKLEFLTTSKPIAFNRALMTLRTDRSILVKQRAQATYIAAICQPEALFNLSTAAQCQKPTTAEAKALNLQLQ